MSISINKKWECSGQIRREPRSHDENICHTEWQEFARVFFHVTCIISQQNLLLCVIWILGTVLVMKAMCYTLLKCWIYFIYQLLHVKKNTTSVIHTIVVKWVFFYVKRQLIVNSSQNFLTYLSGENMGRRPSSGPSQSPPVVKVRRGTPAPLQCHQCQALFLSLSLSQKTNQIFFRSVAFRQSNFHKEQSSFSQTRHPDF